MTLEERMVKIEAAFGAQSDLVRKLRDAVTVTAELEARQGRALRDDGEWLAEQDLRWKRAHEQRERDRAEWKARGEELDRRISALVSGFGEFISRKPN